MRGDLLPRLPPPTAVLLVVGVLGRVHAVDLILPQQTAVLVGATTLPHHALDVVAWPPLPTSPPADPWELRRRQDTNTICGYLGGDAALPATCGAGSHCVMDPEHKAIGCCPNGEEPCTTGIFTGCVDGNSPAQTEINPYIFTCGGGDACYKNDFGGGYYQFGCGTAADLATSVAAIATGVSTTATLQRESQTFSFTATPSSLSEPTTLATVSVTSTGSTVSSASSTSTVSSTTSTSSSTTSTTSSTSSSSTSSTSTSSSSPSSTTTAGAAAVAASHSPSLGAIIGGTISGVAVLVAVLLIGFWLRRRRQGNARQGPGGPPGGATQYISPAGARAGFVPVHQTYDGYETGRRTESQSAEFYHDQNFGVTTTIQSGAPVFAAHPAVSPLSPQGDEAFYPPGGSYHYPGQYPAAYAAGAAPGLGSSPTAISSHSPAAAVHLEPEQVPLTYEIGDFSRDLHAPLSRIGEEDEYGNSSRGVSGEQPYAAANETAAGTYGHAHDPSGASTLSPLTHHNMVSEDEEDLPAYGSRPLWQQNRSPRRGGPWM